MSKNHYISHDDKALIDEFSAKFASGLNILEKIKQFQVGDYLILYLGNDDNKMSVQKNSYGAPIKFKVVHCTEHGIPFVNRVNKRGVPIGGIFSCLGTLDTDTFRNPGQKFEFALDPDYADSILLQDEYDPANLHRSKKDIWKAVTDHNKTCKISTYNMKDVLNFFNTVNVGDMLWTSNISHFLVQDKKTMTPQNFNSQVGYRHKTQVKSGSITILTVKDKNGKVMDISPDFFHCKALYKERPRTYKELNI